MISRQPIFKRRTEWEDLLIDVFNELREPGGNGTARGELARRLAMMEEQIERKAGGTV